MPEIQQAQLSGFPSWFGSELALNTPGPKDQPGHKSSPPRAFTSCFFFSLQLQGLQWPWFCSTTQKRLNSREEKKASSSSEPAGKNMPGAGSDPTRHCICRTGAKGLGLSTQQSTARLTQNVFFGKGIQNVFSGQAQFIQDCTVELLCYSLAPAQVAEHWWSCTLLHAGIWQKH